jgi:hypothetical protein
MFFSSKSAAKTKTTNWIMGSTNMMGSMALFLKICKNSFCSKNFKVLIANGF